MARPVMLFAGPYHLNDAEIRFPVLIDGPIAEIALGWINVFVTKPKGIFGFFEPIDYDPGINQFNFAMNFRSPRHYVNVVRC
ncbi:MAG: hypothetical protein ACYTBJ_00660 [Planctomycetota bacterium]|jgi:hypothetical protein